MPSGLSCRRRIAVIGYGAITREIVSCLESLNSLDSLAGVLVRADKEVWEIVCALSARFPEELPWLPFRPPPKWG